MKKTCCLSAIAAAEVSAASMTFKNARLDFTLLGDGEPAYAFSLNGKDAILPSTTGFETSVGDMTKGFKEIECAISEPVCEKWRPVWGEEEEITDEHWEMLVRLEQKGTGRKMDVRFRLFADGMGFRYEFPEKSAMPAYFDVKEERTSFTLPGDPQAWWIPADYDTQEYRYFNSRCSEIPALYGSADRSNVSFSRRGSG